MKERMSSELAYYCQMLIAYALLAAVFLAIGYAGYPPDAGVSSYESAIAKLSQYRSTATSKK